MYWKIILVLSLSKLPQPPFLHCMANSHAMARCGHLVLIALAGIVHLAQRQQHLRGVVGVGIKLVVELEVPAAGLGVGHLHGPVALVANFFGEHPIDGLDHARIVARPRPPRPGQRPPAPYPTPATCRASCGRSAPASLRWPALRCPAFQIRRARGSPADRPRSSPGSAGR